MKSEQRPTEGSGAVLCLGEGVTHSSSRQGRGLPLKEGVILGCLSRGQTLKGLTAVFLGAGRVNVSVLECLVGCHSIQ